MRGPDREQRRFYHSIRFKLMLVSLSLLLIPWAGYRYIGENEQFLRTAQEDVLLGTAQAVAATLHNRPQLFLSGASSSSRRPEQFLYIHPLSSALQVDGYIEDWLPYIHNSWHYSDGKQLAFDLLLAQNDLHLYLLLQVEDQRVLFRHDSGTTPENHDWVLLNLADPAGTLHQYRIDTSSPGWVSVTEMVDGGHVATLQRPQPLIRGEWQNSRTGYTLELRIPRYLVGDRLAVTVEDSDDPASGPAGRLSTLPGDDRQPNRLLTPDPEMQRIISGIDMAGARIWVVDRFQRVLARQGSLRAATTLETEEAQVPGLLKMLFNLLLPQPTEQFEDELANRIQIQAPEIATALTGTPDTRRRSTPDERAVILSATWPIHSAGGIVGAVLVEQTTNRILSLQNRAIEGLFGITLLLFITTSLLLLGFATLLSGRVLRLRNRIEAAVTPDGRIIGQLPAEHARDEIGDLGRSFAGVLDRLQEYNRYLEAMASRLAHELRTPLTVVRTSLDNLAQEASPEGRARYIGRAREGIERLALILHRMREATRLEQLMQQTERERFDLGELLRLSCDNYRSAFTDLQIDPAIPPHSLMIDGSADLLSQALDKLIGNARDFHTPGTPVALGLHEIGRDRVRLTIGNQGPALPAGMEKSIFDSMVSLRETRGEEPHLGLGLYLVRLICEYHGGEIRARNLAQPPGVEFIIELPLSTEP